MSASERDGTRDNSSENWTLHDFNIFSPIFFGPETHPAMYGAWCVHRRKLEFSALWIWTSSTYKTDALKANGVLKDSKCNTIHKPLNLGTVKADIKD